jgi:hypothetical protein
MTGQHLRRIVALLAAAILATSCGMPGQGTKPVAPFTADIKALGDAIAVAATYAPGSIELTSSPVRLRISVTDSQLATADESTRNAAAVALVGAAEKILASHPEYSQLQAVSVAIVHSGSDWHVEDVIEFRKGPDQRFVAHTT